MMKSDDISAAENIMVSGEKVKIREKTLADARNDYSWCRDLELSRLDAAQPLNMSFSDFVSEYTAELRYPSLTRRRFGVDTLGGEHIGNCSYYNIDIRRGETEVGIMIGNRDYWGKGYGTDTIKTLVNYIFRETTFDRLYLKTLEGNLRAQTCFKKSGFLPYNHLVRDGHKFMLMELTRNQWQKLQKENIPDERDIFPTR